MQKAENVTTENSLPQSQTGVKSNVRKETHLQSVSYWNKSYPCLYREAKRFDVTNSA